MDTGFIVHNDHMYPNFIQLLKRIGASTQPSTRASVACARTGLNTTAKPVRAFAAQKPVNPAFHRLVAQIVRFTRQACAFLRDGDPATR